MNSKAALAKALLDGRTVNIKNGFDLLGITNVPREIGRSIERAFGVTVKRIDRNGLSRYKVPVVWMDYRLEYSEENREGIIRMKEYVNKQLAATNPKTDKELKQLSLI